MKSKSILKLKNNFKVTFEGEPSLKVKKVKLPSLIGVSPLKYNFIKAKLVVKEGEEVKKGQALFFDKKNPQVYFHSPVSGSVKAI
ncbi:MAG: NADH:ubiquinone reductase (Na(+)-transporting) subunit A, partial [Candidatus Margulisiibacteriota bacterium]|nr:NADH:ubiquinone reductase (Na(+)-transporting) subunit A [Candidatus Margulisiibacteriota bacterium]